MKKIEQLRSLSDKEFAAFLASLATRCTESSIHRKRCKQCEDKLCRLDCAEQYLNKEC